MQPEREALPVHDAAHDAFMTLPAYAIPGEDEVKLGGERDKIAYLRHYGTHPQHEQENEGLRGACSCQRRNQRLMRSYLCVLCSMICSNEVPASASIPSMYSWAETCLQHVHEKFPISFQ